MEVASSGGEIKVLAVVLVAFRQPKCDQGSV
jgi:hypothetical protein